MLSELFIAILMGIGFGILTGLIPGLHINLISILIISFSAYLTGFFDLASLSSFIISMSITHTFLDVIPAVFLGAPDSDTALGVLPGHALLLEGRGYEAIKLTVIGSLLSLIFSLLLVPLLLVVIPKMFAYLQDYIGWILLVIVVYMILRDKKMETILWNLVVFLLAGVLGIFVLTWPNLNQPLFPMLSGLFGVSMLVVSLSNKVNIPEQKITEKISLGKTESVKTITSATLSGSLVSFFPGLGPAQAAIIGSEVMRKISNYGFLVLVGGINTVNMAISLITLHALDKARNGSVLAVQELLGQINLETMILLLGVALFAAGLATFLTLGLTRVFVKVINRINYQLISAFIIVFITALVLYFSSFTGLLILFVATMIGIIPNVMNIKRNHLMGCLLLPVILFFLL